MQASDRLRLGIVDGVEIVVRGIKRRSSRRERHSRYTCDTGGGIDGKWPRRVEIRIHTAKACLIALPHMPNGRAGGGTDCCSR